MGLHERLPSSTIRSRSDNQPDRTLPTPIDEEPIYQSGTQIGQYLYTYVTGIEGAGTGTLLHTVPSTVGGNSSSTGYIYDPLNRLTAANTTNGPTYSYTYDGDGNMLSQVVNGTTTTSYGYTGDEQTNIGGSTATYDLAGNITNVATTNLAYNTLDQPTSQGGFSSSFFGGGEDDETGVAGSTLQNTALGLTGVSQSGATSYFTVDPSGDPIGELTPSGDYYFITNPVTNTVMYTIDANGDANTARTNTYSPYGTQTTTGSGPDDLGWNGAFTAANFSIYHFGARQYASAVNRWTQPDPDIQSLVADPVQADPYVFAGDDPVNAADPAGTNYEVDAIEEPPEGSFPNPAAEGGSLDPEAFLDATGKVHGQLPHPADLGEYGPESLEMLRDQLEQSVQHRIAKIVELGSDYGHSARIAEEQQLIWSIDKYHADRPPGP